MTRWVILFNSERNPKQVRCILETALNKAEAINRHVEAWGTDDIKLLQDQVKRLKVTQGEANKK